jgi:hypothetical protein
MTHRVELPAYTDRWMMGDRYGTVVNTSTVPQTSRLYPGRTVLHIQLDKSGKTVKALSDDCRDI